MARPKKDGTQSTTATQPFIVMSADGKTAFGPFDDKFKWSRLSPGLAAVGLISDKPTLIPLKPLALPAGKDEETQGDSTKA